MHDIDHTRLETGSEYEGQDELDAAAREDREFEAVPSAAFEMPMSEAEEEELAAELLGVNSEAEMDQFLGGLFRRIGRGIKGAASVLSRVGRPLAGALKGIAAKALPALGGILGTAVPIPGVGTALGSALGRVASQALQSETDHLEAEEQEFESARRFVRLATQTVRQAARLRRHTPPRALTGLALRQAVARLRRAAATGVRPVYRTVYRTVPASCPPCPACRQSAGADALPLADPGDGISPAYDAAIGGPTEDLVDDSGTNGSAPESGGEGAEYEDNGELEDQFEAEDQERSGGALPSAGLGGGRSGRWVRRGQRIVLYGL